VVGLRETKSVAERLATILGPAERNETEEADEEEEVTFSL
jgi:hypothetical protein